MPGKKQSIQKITYFQYDGNTTTRIDGGVIEEALMCIHVNGLDLVTFMCSPHNLEELAIGFLRSEGFIRRMDDIDLLTKSKGETCIDIWLKDRKFTPPSGAIVTSGCGGGVTFDDLSGKHEPLDSTVTIRPEQIVGLQKTLIQRAELYNEVRGVHTSGISDGRNLLLVAQDVGRHNTIDRLWGQALAQNIETKDRILLASGRISSEMLNKAAKMGAPIVISRTSPTSLSVELAQAWNITIVGYVRGNNFRVYSTPERVIGL